MLPTAKSLHWSLFVKDRAAEIAFYKNILGMKVIRHREYQERGGRPPKGFKAKWSTTLLRYGDEPTHFAVQLVFSYNNQLEYEQGNRYMGMTIQSHDIIDRAFSFGLEVEDFKKTGLLENGIYKMIKSPAGYKFFIIDKPQPESGDPIKKIHLMCSSVYDTWKFWHCFLGGKIFSLYQNHSMVIGFGEYGVKIKFRKTDKAILQASHGCCLTLVELLENLNSLQEFLKTNDVELPFEMAHLDETEVNGSILTMIIQDFDGHQIALCDELGYEKHLTEPQEDVDEVLANAMRKEKVNRREVPIVTKTDATLYKMIDAFDDYTKCQRKRSFRILGPFPDTRRL